MESTPKLSTPEEELAYLRERVAQKEQELAGHEPERTRIISEQIHEHHAAPKEVLATGYRMTETSTSKTADKILAELNLGGSEQAIKNRLGMIRFYLKCNTTTQAVAEALRRKIIQ